MKTNFKNKMRNYSTALLMLITCGMLYSHTENPVNEKGMTVETQIKNHISFPNIIIPAEQTESVEVLFTTNQNGKVDFVLAKTPYESLKKEIEKQFVELILPSLKPGVTHRVVLNIKKV